MTQLQTPTLGGGTPSGADAGTTAALPLNAAGTALLVETSGGAAPSGSATAARQDTGNTSLATIATASSSQATAAKQDTAQTSLTAIASSVAAAATAAAQTTAQTSLTAIAASLVLLQQPTRSNTVTKSDSTDLTALATKGLIVGTAGDLSVKYLGDSTATVLKNIPSGTYIPGAFSRVMAATTAADIVSLYGP